LTFDLRTAFLVLVLAQAAHSIEEYVFRLYDVFLPARLVSGLFSSDLRRGFAIGNILLVAWAAWCYFARVRPRHPTARTWIWFWTILEGANGTGHILFAIERGGYFPGVFTAPLLLGVSLFLVASLMKSSEVSSNS